jgi:aminoglycoside 3-N-acetyltransferase
MPNQDLLELAEKSRKSDSHVRKGRAVSANRTLVELKTIRTALRKPPGVLDGRNEQDYYRAGVDPTTGLWPETLDLKKIDERISAQEKKTARYRKPVRQADSRNAREQADRMVPLALFRGFLSFEDHVSPESIKELKSRTGLRPRWGAEKWLWMLTTFFRGKQTLLEAVEHLRSLGREVDLETAVKATNYLADKGMVRLRPILDSADIGRSLRELQIKPGSTVMLHASLSRFGYIRGGCRTIIEGVRKQIGPRGTMIMPTHSLSTLGKEPFTPDSPSRVGAVGEHFRKMKGVKRSSHPTHSVAAIGPEAGNLVSEHAPDKAAFDPEGFWGRFYDLNGHVLLMAPITSATIFHVGETWAGLPQRSCIAHSKAANGKRRLHHIPNAPLHVGHFGKTMAEPLMKEGRMKQTALGEDAVYCGRAKDMIDKSTEVNRQNPLVSLGKGGLCNCAFCRVLKKGIRDSG